MYVVQKTAANTRNYRNWHRKVAILSAAFLLLVAVTGLLLAWKKNSFGYLQAEEINGTDKNPDHWQSLSSVQSAAIAYLQRHYPDKDTLVDRIDIRPKKAMAKVLFVGHYTAIHIDLSTAAVLQAETRRADFIERLHDGSIVDDMLPLHWGKQVFSSFTGFSLLALIVTGFYLWMNPRKIRKHKRRHRKKHLVDLSPPPQ